MPKFYTILYQSQYISQDYVDAVNVWTGVINITVGTAKIRDVMRDDVTGVDVLVMLGK